MRCDQITAFFGTMIKIGFIFHIQRERERMNTHDSVSVEVRRVSVATVAHKTHIPKRIAKKSE